MPKSPRFAGTLSGGTLIFRNWPKDVKYMVSNGRGELESVTFADIKAERIKRQRERLARIVRIDDPDRQACYVWVFFVPGVLYGGWHLYLCTLREKLWIGRDFGHGTYRWDPFQSVCQSIMEAFPCGLLPLPDNFQAWKIAFAKTYKRPGRRKNRKQGVVFGWAVFERGKLKRFEPV